jgi:hypothetical protein
MNIKLPGLLSDCPSYWENFIFSIYSDMGDASGNRRISYINKLLEPYKMLYVRDVEYNNGAILQVSSEKGLTLFMVKYG